MGTRMTPVDDEGRGGGGPSRAVVVVFAGVFAAAFALLALVAAAAVIILAGLGNSLSHIGERDHLKPIPISTKACPYVALMHAAANDFQAHEPVFGMMLDAEGRPMPVARERTIVGPPLARLEFAIAVSKPHFPAAVRAQLAITQDAAHQGRAQLARATDPMSLMNSTSTLLSAGRQAFGYASDLVGTQCGHRLGADSNVGPYFGPGVTVSSTTTASRS